MNDSPKKPSLLKTILPEPQMLIALSAGLISLCALSISFYEINLMREQQKATVWPHLEMAHNNVDGVSIQVDNRGVGPARIEAVIVTVDGKLVKNWQEFLDQLVGEKPGVPHFSSWFNGRVIPQGDSVKVFQIRDQALAAEVFEQMSRINVVVCYSSIYGDYYRMGHEEGETLMPSDCSCDPENQFQYLSNGRSWKPNKTRKR